MEGSLGGKFAAAKVTNTSVAQERRESGYAGQVHTQQRPKGRFMLVSQARAAAGAPAHIAPLACFLVCNRKRHDPQNQAGGNVFGWLEGGS